MSIQIKHIGNQDYKYEVTWDEKEKKQQWRYIGKVTNEPESVGNMDDPGILGKLKILLYSALGLSIISGFFVHSHAFFWWDVHPLFYAIYGFVICVTIILVSKTLGHYLKREVNYYD